jgi:multidrug resistance efflux pump
MTQTASNQPPQPTAQAGVATDAARNAQDTATTAAPPDTGPPKTIKPRPRTVAIMAVVLLAGILLVLWAWRLGPFATAVVATNNSYIRGQITVMAPQVNGHVADVLVRDFQTVGAGQPLIQIDDRIYRERVREAEARLDQAQARLANAEQQVAQNRATIGARRAEAAAARAEHARAANEEKRFNQLAGSGSVSLSERDQARANASVAAARVETARAQIDIAEQAAIATEVSRAALRADVKIAQAELALARIDLDNTVIRAPRDGQLGEVSVRLGQYVAAGSQLLFLVPDTIWVTANFKETQTSAVQIGQRAEFSVDGLDDRRFTGTVEQISPATGSEFSVLRSDNATGNFTKVVQRLPIRIAIDVGQPDIDRLRPGMSVVTRIDTSSSPRQGTGQAEPGPVDRTQATPAS